MEKWEKMMEEIRTLDENGKEAVEKCLKILKAKKEVKLEMPTRKILDIYFSFSAAGALAIDYMSEDFAARNKVLFNLSANWDLGPLNQGILTEDRERFWNTFPPVGGVKKHEKESLKDFSIAQNDMENLDHYLKEVEKVRIWYSNTARDLCGLYFICDYLANSNFQGQVSYVFCDEAERYELDVDIQEFVTRIERRLTDEEIQKYQKEWKRLVEENASLRIYKEGRVLSAAEDYYDDFIWPLFNEKQLTQRQLWENIMAHDEDFENMGHWFCYRVEQFIKEGKIAVVEELKRKSRILAKTELFSLSEEQLRIGEEEKERKKLYDQVEEKLDSLSIDQLRKILEIVKTE